MRCLKIAKNFHIMNVLSGGQQGIEDQEEEAKTYVAQCGKEMKKSGITKEEYEQFVTDAREYMYYLAFSVLKNPADAQDAVSESLLKMWECRDQLYDSASRYAWVNRTVLNTARTMLKKNHHVIPVGEIPERLFKTGDDWMNLWEYAGELEERERMAVFMHYYEGYRQKEIAEMLHIPEGTLKSRLYRARKKLRVLMKEDGFDRGRSKNKKA